MGDLACKWGVWKNILMMYFPVIKIKKCQKMPRAVENPFCTPFRECSCSNLLSVKVPNLDEPGGKGGCMQKGYDRTPGGYSGFQVMRMIEGFFWVAWFFVGTFGGIKKNRYCPGGCIVLWIKYRLSNVFCFCLIVNYGVALHRTCYTIVCIVSWYPAAYKTNQPLQFSQLALLSLKFPFALVNFWFLSLGNF